MANHPKSRHFVAEVFTGIWQKPFQNMRASRATELVAIYPAHVVNAIMGHTEAVAMAHYRQVLNGDFEKLSALVTDKKKGADSVHEHAILGLQGLETKNSEIDATSTVSTPCNEKPLPANSSQTTHITRLGLEPRIREPKSLVLPITPPGSTVPILVRIFLLSRDRKVNKKRGLLRYANYG